MKSRGRIVPCLFVLVVLAGCASTKVTNQEIYVTEKIPRPNHIFVYDFAATPADVPASSVLAGRYSDSRTSQTSEEIATGRRLGAQIAAQLVERIRGMGLPADRGSVETRLQINDLVIRGYLVSVEEGSQGELQTWNHRYKFHGISWRLIVSSALNAFCRHITEFHL